MWIAVFLFSYPIITAVQTSLRILDVLFFEGHESTFLFKVALAILKLHQNEVLEQSESLHVCGILKRPSLDCDVLLEVF